MNPEELKAVLGPLFVEQLKPFQDGLTALQDKVARLTVPSPPPEPPAPPAPPPPPEPPVAPLPGLTPEANAELLANRRLMTDMKTRMEALQADAAKEKLAAEKARHDSAVSAALGEIKFAPGAREVGEGLFSKEVRREGERYIAGDNLTPEAHAKLFFTEKHAYLLAPNGSTGGSGVTTPNGQVPVSSGGKVATTEMIRNGMSAEDLNLVRAGILAALPR